MSRYEDVLAFQLRHASSFPFEQQYRFHPTRKWRADFAVWPNEEWHGIHQADPPMLLPLLVEVEGAVRGKPGHHQRVDGMEADCEKYAAAMCRGHYVLRVMPSQVISGVALQWIEQMMDVLLNYGEGEAG